VIARCRVLLLSIGLLLGAVTIAWAQESPDGQLSDSPTAVVSTHAGADTLYPNPALTPGAIFDGASSDQICVPGYATSVRGVTSAERAQVYAEYGISDVRGADEVDHFIPLELGGSNDIANLWPEPYTVPGAHEKDRVENFLHDQVCSSALALADAQQMIVSDWYAVYLTLPIAATPTDTITPAPTATPNANGPTGQAVAFSSVVGGSPGGRASVVVQADPGATCSVQYVTPAGSKSTAQGQGADITKALAQDGTATWNWDIGPSTKPGVGTVTATCTTGTATTPITIA